MTDLRNLIITLECRECGQPIYPIFVGLVVESWQCPAGHEQKRTLER